MSSRFVSTGAIDVETGDSVPVPAQPPPASAPPSNNKSAEWAAVQAQLETERQARAAKRKAEAEGEHGQSLFEVLEANKAAKQAAFEEANKISNQFRALDEDEIGFLEEVQQRKREEEERVRRETEEGLRVFRQARKGEAADIEEEEAHGGGWRVGGKRKRRKGESEGGRAGLGLLKGVKRMSQGGAAENDAEDNGEKAAKSQRHDDKAVEKDASLGSKTPASAAQIPPAPAPAPKSKLGLVDYGSDDDSE